MKALILISALLIMFSCSNHNNILGSWKFVGIEVEKSIDIDPMAVFPLVFLSEDLKGTIFTFKEDLTINLNKEGEIKVLNYELLENNKIIINKDTSVYSFKTDTLYMKSNGAISKFIKVE